MQCDHLARDAKSSARTYFANGREPQLSPDGHTVAYASVRRIGEGEHSCGALDMGVRDLGTGSDRVIRIGDADTSAGVVALHLLWSPNGRKVAMWIGIDRSESAGSMLVDLGTATAARVRVASDVEAVFNVRVGTRAEEIWELYARVWLSDGTLVVGATCCYGMADLARERVASWWYAGRDGVISSLDHAVTDPAVLAVLPVTVFG